MGIGIKRSETGGSGIGAARRIKEALSLFSDFNKVDESTDSGKAMEKEPLLALDMEDGELLKLATSWQNKYKKYASKFESRQKKNKEYWLGHQYGFKREDYHFVDNIIFSDLETLLPIISRQNPTPFVVSHDIQVAEDTSRLIENIADREALKVKIKKCTRHWALSFLGVMKITWNNTEKAIDVDIVRTKNIILDPNGCFDGGEFAGRYIGQRRKETAEELSKMFPDSKEYIEQKVSNKMGTELEFIEWWTNDYTFWTFDNNRHVLDKRKNLHWNEDEDVEVMNEFGEFVTKTIPGHNHFKAPKMPFAFLSVFNLDEQPHDETSLVEQAIPLQDQVNKRARQIDKNADDSNNGWVFNNQFSEEAARSALKSLRRGGAIIAPTTSIGESVTRLTAPTLPTYIINDLADKRNQVHNIMGTRGSSAAGIASERTVQGKIEIRQTDADRASLIVEHLEQTIDYVYNYAVQMMFVYYDGDILKDILGEEKGANYLNFLETEDAPTLTVSVKEGSLIPQDPLLRRNEAVDLAQVGLLDPLTMFERMNFPNPKEATKRLIAYSTDPTQLLAPEGEEGEAMQMQANEQIPIQNNQPNF